MKIKWKINENKMKMKIKWKYSENKMKIKWKHFCYDDKKKIEYMFKVQAVQATCSTITSHRIYNLKKYYCNC